MYLQLRNIKKRPEIPLKMEVTMGETGPFSEEESPIVNINFLRVIPKRTWRVITNLSYPKMHSINNDLDS